MFGRGEGQKTFLQIWHCGKQERADRPPTKNRVVFVLLHNLNAWKGSLAADLVACATAVGDGVPADDAGDSAPTHPYGAFRQVQGCSEGLQRSCGVCFQAAGRILRS